MLQNWYKFVIDDFIDTASTLRLEIVFAAYIDN